MPGAFAFLSETAVLAMHTRTNSNLNSLRNFDELTYGSAYVSFVWPVCSG